MGARQSRQSVNITTPATGKESATTSGATTTDTSGNVTEVGTVAVPVTTDVSGDIKNIIGESGVSSTGKIEPIPDMDILLDTDAEIACGSEAKAETKKSSDDQVMATSAGDISAATSEAVITDATSNNNNNNVCESKKKKLKKKWSLRNISFSRKDKTKPSKEDKDKDKAVAAPVAEPDKLLSNTAAALVVPSDNDESNKNDLNESSTVEIAAVAENEKSVVQEIIEEEVVESVNVDNTTSVTEAEVAVDTVIKEEVVEGEVDDKKSPLPSVEKISIVAVELNENENENVEIIEEKLEEIVADETIVVNDSLNEKMNCLTINDDHSNVMTEPVKVIIISDNDDDDSNKVLNGLKNDESGEKKPELTATESLPEPVIEFGSGDKKCDDVTVVVNGNPMVLNGNGQVVKELNENNVDSFSNPESLSTSPIKSSPIKDSNDIIVMKNTQKQQVKEKSYDLMNFDENGLEHIVDNKIMEKTTNGFPSSPEIVKD